MLVTIVTNRKTNPKTSTPAHLAMVVILLSIEITNSSWWIATPLDIYKQRSVLHHILKLFRGFTCLRVILDRRTFL